MRTKAKISITITLLAVAIICTTALAKKEKEETKSKLPAKVKSSLQKNYPGCDIETIKEENPEIVIYEVDLELKDGSDIEVLSAADGTILSIEVESNISDLPFDLSSCLPAHKQIKEIESETTYAELKPIVLPEPIRTYKVEVVIDGGVIEYTFDKSGNIIKQEIEDIEKVDKSDHKGNKENDEDKACDEDENEVSFSQLPDSVQNTLTFAAKNGKVKEIEMENGIYQADIIINGEKHEVKISDDGQVLSNKIDPDDDDEDNNEDIEDKD